MVLLDLTVNTQSHVPLIWCPAMVVPGLPGSHDIVVVAVTVSQPRCGSNGCENTSCSAVAGFPVEDVFTVVADAGGHRATFIYLFWVSHKTARPLLVIWARATQEKF